MKHILLTLLLISCTLSGQNKYAEVNYTITGTLATPGGDSLLYHYGQWNGESDITFEPIGTKCYIMRWCRLKWIGKIGSKLIVEVVSPGEDQAWWIAFSSGNYYSALYGNFLSITQGKWDELKRYERREEIGLREKAITDSVQSAKNKWFSEQVSKLLEGT